MKTLVIGYGNTLREDDGVGYRVAEQVAEWEVPGITAIACHQLTPELAVEIAQCDRVIFVDASLPGMLTAPTLAPLTAAHTPLLEAHRSDPPGLLQLAAQLYDRRPQAWQMLLPTATMEFGETLSAIAQQGSAAAIAHLRTLMQPDSTLTAPPSPPPSNSIPATPETAPQCRP